MALHFHDTRRAALANILVGLERGVRIYDASAGGLGGCPYAPGATGNVATEDVVYLMESFGLKNRHRSQPPLRGFRFHPQKNRPSPSAPTETRRQGVLETLRKWGRCGASAKSLKSLASLVSKIDLTMFSSRLKYTYMIIARNIFKGVKEDIEEKIVMIGGPRQVGKTTFAQGFIALPEQYLNWDVLDDRAKIKAHQIDPELEIVVLDEIHKYPRWRGLIKGCYDKYKESLKIIVTGSAQLDHFRKGGDSLFGRFFYYRLHPLSYNEVPSSIENTLERLLTFGGFPEPFLKSSPVFHKRWQRERLSRVVYQDIRDMSQFKEIGLLELLLEVLPERVASPLSLKNLGEDLQVSPITVGRWIEILERVYYCFRIIPFGSPKIRAVKKTSKLYLWDWSEVPTLGARFENLVAAQLLKFCHFQEDTQGERMELRYLKDIDNREIDFVVLKNKKPLFAVECKTGEEKISKHIRYFQKRTSIPHYYQVHLNKKIYADQNVDVLPFSAFCRKLKMP